MGIFSNIKNIFVSTNKTEEFANITVSKRDLSKDLISDYTYMPYVKSNPTDKIKQVKLYETIYETPIVNLCENVLRSGVLQIPYIITGPDEKQVEMIQKCFKDDINIKQVINGLLDARIYGYMIAEKVYYTTPRGSYKLRSIKFKKPWQFQFETDPYDNLTGLYYTTGADTYKNVNDSIYNKFVIATWPDVVFGNYYGTSEYYPIVEIVNRYNASNIMLDQAFKYLLTKPIIHYFNSQTNPEDISKVKAVVNGLSNSSVVHIPASRNAKTDNLEKDYLIEVLPDRADKEGLAPLRDEIKKLEDTIKLSLGVPLDIIGSSGTGSYARAKTQYLLYSAKVEQMQAWIEETINKQIIQPFININFGKQDEYPMFRFEETNEEVTQVKADVIQKLVTSGVIDEREEWIREYLGVPAIDEEEQAMLDESREEDIQEDVKEPEEVPAIDEEESSMLTDVLLSEEEGVNDEDIDA